MFFVTVLLEDSRECLLRWGVEISPDQLLSIEKWIRIKMERSDRGRVCVCFCVCGEKQRRVLCTRVDDTVDLYRYADAGRPWGGNAQGQVVLIFCRNRNASTSCSTPLHAVRSVTFSTRHCGFRGNESSSLLTSLPHTWVLGELQLCSFLLYLLLNQMNLVSGCSSWLRYATHYNPNRGVYCHLEGASASNTIWNTICCTEMFS